MAQEYANNKPKGFKNHIEKVAIVGVCWPIQIVNPISLLRLQQVGGSVGKYVVDELVKTGKYKVSAITRDDSTSKVPAGVEVKKVNYDNQDSLYVFHHFPLCFLR